MQTIYLDISNKGVTPCIQAKQSEVGRKFLAVITDNGVPYNIPSDSLLSVWYEGDTDAGNYSSIEEKSAFSIDGNKVSVELVAQMLLKPGNGELCLSITYGDGGETNTWNIPYYVEYKPGAGSSVPTEYYTAFQETASLVAKYADEAKESAEQVSLIIPEINAKQNKIGISSYSGDFNDIETLRNTVTWVKASNGENHSPPTTAYGVLETWSNGSAIIIQRFTATGRNVAVRMYYNAEWTEWEWDNPTRTPGVEYLTTEKYNGKEVYTMLVDCGAWADGKTVTVNVGQIISVFDSCGSVGRVNLPYYYVSDDYPSICMYNIEEFGVGATITLCGNYTRFQGWNTKILIKYTKT